MLIAGITDRRVVADLEQKLQKSEAERSRLATSVEEMNQMLAESARREEALKAAHSAAPSAGAGLLNQAGASLAKPGLYAGAGGGAYPNEQEYEELRKRCEAAESNLHETEKTLRETEAELSHTQAVLRETQMQLREAMSKLEKSEDQREHNQGRLSSAEADLSDAEATLGETVARLSEMDSKLRGTQAELSAALKKLDDRNDEVSRLEAQLRNTEADLARTRTKLQESINVSSPRARSSRGRRSPTGRESEMVTFDRSEEGLGDGDTKYMLQTMLAQVKCVCIQIFCVFLQSQYEFVTHGVKCACAACMDSRTGRSRRIHMHLHIRFAQPYPHDSGAQLLHAQERTAHQSTVDTLIYLISGVQSLTRTLRVEISHIKHNRGSSRGSPISSHLDDSMNGTSGNINSLGSAEDAEEQLQALNSLFAELQNMLRAAKRDAEHTIALSEDVDQDLVHATRSAEASRRDAESAHRAAERARADAEAARKEALAANIRADEASREAERLRRDTEAAIEDVKRVERQADVARRDAEQARKDAER